MKSPPLRGRSNGNPEPDAFIDSRPHPSLFHWESPSRGQPVYGIMETISAVIFILTPPLAGFLYEHDPMILYPLGIGLIAGSILVSYVFTSRMDKVTVTSY